MWERFNQKRLIHSSHVLEWTMILRRVSVECLLWQWSPRTARVKNDIEQNKRSFFAIVGHCILDNACWRLKANSMRSAHDVDVCQRQFSALHWTGLPPHWHWCCQILLFDCSASLTFSTVAMLFLLRCTCIVFLQSFIQHMHACTCPFADCLCMSYSRKRKEFKVGVAC